MGGETVRKGNSMKKYTDGWHIVAGENVLVENGKIIRAIKGQGNNAVSAQVYVRADNGTGWCNAGGSLTPSQFYFRKRRGTAAIF